MKIKIRSTNGRTVAYIAMLAMLALSIAGNVAHTYHIDPTPSVRSVVYAVMWPIMVWLGVEMFVRVSWPTGIAAWLVRWVGISLVAFIAGLVSYRHIRGLLKADGEDGIVYTVGPLAIDGLMLMATLALLLTRKIAATGQQIMHLQYARPIGPMPAPYAPRATETMEQELERITLADVLPQPISPAPDYSTQQLTEFKPEEFVTLKPRAPRASNGEREQKVRAMLADPALTAVDSTMRRYARVARILRDDPTADIDHKAERVQRDTVETIIRPWANLERVR